jgi:6-pyruvoyltetrahydropterin/6-carboxytetrahydropterin synthase
MVMGDHTFRDRPVVSLTKVFRFEAAHRLPRVPEGHQCARMHGHGFLLEIEVEGPVDPAMGWVMDFADLTAAVKPVLAQLDHSMLNDVDGLENPTSENLVRWIWDRLQPGLPLLTRVGIAETCTARCDYRGERR